MTDATDASDAEASARDEHPARTASQKSMAAVEAHDREGWLALFAEDALIQDPIGVSALDPTGLGHHGKAAIATFWDSTIAPNQIRFDIVASHSGGKEVANVGSITTTLPDGNRVIVDGVYTYKVDDTGVILALRAYWEFGNMRFEAPA